MRNGFIELVSATVLVSTVAVAGCTSESATVGAGGSSSVGGMVGTGGSSGIGGSSGVGGSSNAVGTVGVGGSTAGTVVTGGSSAGGGTAAGGASGAGVVTNLSGTKALNALTVTEVTQLCNDSYAYFGTAISRATMCKWKGLAYAISSSAPTDAMLQESCTTQQSTCMQATPDSPSCSDIPTTCTATVAEYSSCIADQATAFSQSVSGLTSCPILTRPDLAAVWDLRTGDPPASCMSLAVKCPDLSPPSPFN